MKIAAFTKITLMSGALMLSFTGANAQDATISVKDWSRDLRAAAESNNMVQFRRLTDFNSMEAFVSKKKSSLDSEAMLKGRQLFAQGLLDQALAQYNLVSKGSDAWLEAVEEKGWVYLRKNDTEKALAQTKTLLGDTFVSVVGSEPFFLQSLAQLKICDYKEILATNALFKKTQRERLVEIQKLVDRGTSPTFDKVLAKADRFPMLFKDFGDEAKLLPRHFHQDVLLQKLVMRIKMAELGLPVLKSVRGHFKEPSRLQDAMLRLEEFASVARVKMKDRLKELAQTETDDNFKMLQKLNLVEVETIQRLHADKNLDKKTYTKGEFAATNSDQLIFPDDGHPWIDELDKYQVKVNSCPQNIRRKM